MRSVRRVEQGENERENGNSFLTNKKVDLSGLSAAESKSMPINRNSGRKKSKSKYFTTSTGNTVENQNKYPCPKPSCDYSDANPSRITDHIAEVHNGKGKGFGNGFDNSDSSNGGSV